MKRIITILAALSCGGILLADAAFAQGSRHDDIVFGPSGHPMAGATITVCTSTATGTPCTPLAQLYTDATLTVPAANPIQSDSLGNYHFYAAPGRYQVQISGPGISSTNTQTDMILPNDPSTPSFSTVTASGAINALTLSLGGNLSVGGSASVTGSLSVNGGPVPSTGTVNGWTAAQVFSADPYFKSGTPWFDVKAFCASGSTSQTTGTISSGSTTLNLASAIDFTPCIVNSGQPGEGVYVYHAGAQSTQAAPTGLTVTAQGTTGSTTYSYQVSALDTQGGQSAATATVTITNGNATLSSTNYNQPCWTPASGANTYVLYRTAPSAQTFTVSDTTPSSAQVCYHDQGSSAWANATTSIPDYASSTPPSSATNDWLETTISAGAGTNSLTLATAATNTATSQIVKHSDTAAIQAATNAANAPMGGIVHFPLGGNYNFSQITWPATGSRGYITWQVDGQLSPMQTILVNQPAVVIHGSTASGNQIFGGQKPCSVVNMGFLNPVFEVSGSPYDITFANLCGNRTFGGDGIFLASGPTQIYLEAFQFGTGGNVIKSYMAFGLHIRDSVQVAWSNVPIAQNNYIGSALDLWTGQTEIKNDFMTGHGIHGQLGTTNGEFILQENDIEPAFYISDTNAADSPNSCANYQTNVHFSQVQLADIASGPEYFVETYGNNSCHIAAFRVDDVLTGAGGTGFWNPSSTQTVMDCEFVNSYGPSPVTGCGQTAMPTGGYFRSAGTGGNGAYNIFGLGTACQSGSYWDLCIQPESDSIIGLAIAQHSNTQSGDLLDFTNYNYSSYFGKVTASGALTGFASFSQSTSSSSQNTFGPLGAFFGGTTMLISPFANGQSGLAIGALSGQNTGYLAYFSNPSSAIESWINYDASFHTQLPIYSTLATGTAPFSVSSTTPVANLTAQYAQTTQLSGTTSSIGGSALGAGTCTSGTVTITNATTSMVAVASPSSDPGTGFTWEAFVSAANTVTVRVCNVSTSSATPTSSTYNVRVIQ